MRERGNPRGLADAVVTSVKLRGFANRETSTGLMSSFIYDASLTVIQRYSVLNTESLCCDFLGLDGQVPLVFGWHLVHCAGKLCNLRSGH